jgi:hypothetical protein
VSSGEALGAIFFLAQSVDSISVPVLIVLAAIGGALSLGVSVGALYATLSAKINNGFARCDERFSRIESVLFDSHPRR